MDKLQAYCINEWITDILKKQLPSILGGVGPMHSFVQIGITIILKTFTHCKLIGLKILICMLVH